MGHLGLPTFSPPIAHARRQIQGLHQFAVPARVSQNICSQTSLVALEKYKKNKDKKV
jgi:hypothetical protein